MSNIVYFNPEFQAQEYSMGLSLDYALKNNFLTKTELLLGIEEQTQRPLPAINDYVKAFSPLSYMHTHFYVNIFSTAEERNKNTEVFRNQHPEYKDFLFYINLPPIKSASYYNVLSKGKILPLKEALAGNQDLATLEQLSKDTEQYLLLYPREKYMKQQKKYSDFFEFLKAESKKSIV